MNREIKIAAMLLLMALLPGLTLADEPNSRTHEAQKVGWKQMEDRAAVVKPTAKELAWLQIPWVLDLNAAQSTAKAERRPIFLWVTGDDPLERC
jgi:hypothetical protein